MIHNVSYKGGARAKSRFASCAAVVWTALAFLASPSSAQAAPSQAMVSFLEALQAENRELAASMVDGPVIQATGYGPEVVGGPHAGRWNRQPVAGKDEVSVDEAFGVLAPCSYRGSGLMSADPAEEAGWISYACPVVVAVIFQVRPSSTPGKVRLSKLGRYLIAKGGLLGFEDEPKK